MAEREFSAITLYFTSPVVSYAPGQLLWDLQERFLEGLWQLSTCHLQNPSIFFAGRFSLVKDSFGGMDNRCQCGPSHSMTAQGKCWRRRKATFFFFFFPQLRAVTLALPVVKASLTEHHILIMPNIILTIAYISRQGVIISSDSIGRPSARWGKIGLSGKAIQLEAN